MQVISFRVDNKTEEKIRVAAQKIGLKTGEYVRNILTGQNQNNISDKLSFYSDLGNQLQDLKNELEKIKETLSIISLFNDNITKIDNDVLIGNQLLCHLLLVTKKREDIQRIIDAAKKELEKNG